MNGALRLGRFAGVDVIADVSVFALAALFGSAVFIRLQAAVPNESVEFTGLVAVAAGIGVVACVFVHEASHVMLALREGLAVREIRLYLFGGYSVIHGVPSARTELLVAVAGPIASVGLGVVILVGPLLLGTQSVIGIAMWALGSVSIAIGVFNLLPGFPLDGGRIVRSMLVSRGRDRLRATRVVIVTGRVVGWSSVVIGASLLLSRQMPGLFWVVGGWYLSTSGMSAGRREVLSVVFDGRTVADVMRPIRSAVPGDSTISSLIELYGVGPRLRSLPVELSGRVVGVIGQDEIDSIAPSRWPSVRARALMTVIGPGDIVEAEAPLETLLFRRAGLSGRAVAVRDGVVVGVIDGDALGPDLAY